MDLSSSLGLKAVPIFSTTRPPLQTSFKTKLIISSCRAATNLYQLLSLESQKVGFEEIKKAYRSMARQYHPDVVPASQKEESTKMFVELQRAYQTLSDPVSRQQYDYQLGSGSGINGSRNQDWKTTYYRQVWENQLRDLEMRDHDRNKARKRRAYI